MMAVSAHKQYTICIIAQMNPQNMSAVVFLANCSGIWYSTIDLPPGRNQVLCTVSVGLRRYGLRALFLCTCVQERDRYGMDYVVVGRHL